MILIFIIKVITQTTFMSFTEIKEVIIAIKAD